MADSAQALGVATERALGRQDHVLGLVAALAPAFVLAMAFLAIGLFRGPTLDASVFILVAERIVAGGMPYLDVWDHKPPGIYVAEALAAGVGWLVDPWARAWLLTLSATVGTAAIVIGARAHRSLLASALATTGMVALVSAPFVSLGGGLTESVAILPASVGLVLCARGGSRSTVLGGVLAGLAVLVSFQAVSAVAGGGLLLAARRRWWLAAAWTAGVALAAVVTLAWLGLGGALVAAYDQLVVFNRAYVAQHDPGQAWIVLYALLTLLLGSPLVVGALARITAVRREPFDDLELGSVAWLGIWLVLVIAQRNFYAHYAIVAAPPLALLATAAFDRLLRAHPRPERRLVSLALIVASFGPAALAANVTAPAPSNSDRIVRAATVVDEVAPPGATLFVWGNEPRLYLDTGLVPASRFVYLAPLAVPGYATPELIDAELRRWELAPPVVVVDASYNPGHAGSHPLLGPWRFEGPRPRDDLDPLRDFVRVEYQAVESVGDWIVYLWNGAS